MTVVTPGKRLSLASRSRGKAREAPALIEPPAVRKRKCAAFTLIELLVVIAIISLLVSILLPSLNRAKELAKRVICASDLRTIAMGINVYSENYDGFLPHCVPSHPYHTETWVSFNALFGDPDGLRDEYFPYEALDCPSDVTREAAEYPYQPDYYPYFGDQSVNLSYAYNAHLIRRTTERLGRWPFMVYEEAHRVEDWQQPADNILMFEVGRPAFYYNPHAQFGGPTCTGGNALFVMGEQHHNNGNNYVFLDGRCTYNTPAEYLDTMRHQGDEIHDPNWGWITINYWADE